LRALRTYAATAPSSKWLSGSFRSHFHRVPISTGTACTTGTEGGSRVRYDNERGKGDHRHIGEKEEDYTFATIDQLLDDFERDIENWR